MNNVVRQYVRANLQPRAIRSTSTSFKQIGHNANVRKQEEEIVVGIVLITVRRGEVAAGPPGTTAACLRQKKAVCKTWWPVLTSIKTICNCQLGERVDSKSHVTAAISCCLEMALWRTLWMVDRCLTAIGGLSASPHQVINELLCM